MPCSPTSTAQSLRKDLSNRVTGMTDGMNRLSKRANDKMKTISANTELKVISAKNEVKEKINELKEMVSQLEALVQFQEKGHKIEPIEPGMTAKPNIKNKVGKLNPIPGMRAKINDNVNRIALYQ